MRPHDIAALIAPGVVDVCLRKVQNNQAAVGAGKEMWLCLLTTDRGHVAKGYAVGEGAISGALCEAARNLQAHWHHLEDIGIGAPSRQGVPVPAAEEDHADRNAKPGTVQ